MIELKKIYQRTSKQTQNKLQEIFDSFQIDFNNLYSIADNKTKKRINTYIEEWQDKGLLTGQFGLLAKNIYKRTRVKNSEILELLIYSAYIEEQNKLNNTELNTFKDVASYYYNEGINEVKKANGKQKKYSVIPDAIFLALLDKPNSKGYIWNEYIEAIVKYNADQIYRQVTIDLQQQKELDITNDIYQNIIKRQNNSKLNINGDKISGDVDLTLIGINNQAKIEGISSIDNNARVRFIAVIDGKETDMCHSLDGQIFYINKENVFDRYYGETQSELSIQRIKCKGLVLGLNLPPISHHFHWCRSTITYLIPNNHVQLESIKNYIIFNSKYEKELNNKYNIKKLSIKHIDKKLLDDILNNIQKVYKDFPQLQGKIRQIKEINHPNGGLAVELQKDRTYIMYVNKNNFYDTKLVKELYANDVKTHFHPKGTTYKDMGIHEAGHLTVTEIIKKSNNNKNNAIVFDNENNITVNKILDKAFNKLGINDIMTKNTLIKNISNYAYQKGGQEIIAEAFADYYSNGNKSTLLSKSIIDVMKGMI